ncbi:MAG: Dockerin type domain, partial [Planctomycetota bacterium]
TDDDDSAGGMPLEPSCEEAILRIEAQVAELEANGSEQALALAADLAGLLDSADESVDGGATRACAILGGDIDGDGTISPADLVAFMAAWAAEDLVSADVNRDGTIDIADLAIVERRIAESATS